MKGWLKIAVACIMASAQTVYARDDWYDPALPLEGNVTVGTLPPGTGSAVTHVRVKAPRWSLTWPSPAGPCHATLTLPPDDRSDDVYVSHATVLIEAGGSATEYNVDNDVSCDDFNSMKIDYDGVRATLFVGSGVAAEVAAVPFGPGEISVSVPAGSLCQRIQLTRHTDVPEPQILEGSLELMLLRVSASEDLNEGVWEYFGKDADTEKVTVGGRYILATVANGKEGYDIVYVAGADAGTGRWQPMTLKGHMCPTIFADDYDLEWIDAGGMAVTGDTYARMSPDHSQLTLGFPAYGATLKFRRVRPADVIQKAGL